MADIFKEVDEEIRHERYAKLWKKYGIYVYIVVGALVTVIGALVFGIKAMFGHLAAARDKTESTLKDTLEAGKAFELLALEIKNGLDAQQASDKSLKEGFYLLRDAVNAMLAKLPGGTP